MTIGNCSSCSGGGLLASSLKTYQAGILRQLLRTADISATGDTAAAPTEGTTTHGPVRPLAARSTLPHNARETLMLFRTLILILLMSLGTSTFAAPQPYNPASFNQALKDGGPVLLMVHADWCPTCRAQAPVVERLAAKPEFSKFRIFRMDYDKEKNGMVLAFRVNRQSALLVFKDGKEVARSIGETNEEAIAALMRKGL